MLTESNSSVLHWLDLKTGLVFVTGMSTGLAIGVLFASLTFSQVKQTTQSTVPTQAVQAAVPERWFIWSGNEPLIGDSFTSEAECNNGRGKVVNAARSDAEQALRELPPISFRQVQALGYNPADRISEQFERVNGAYCRHAAE